MYLKGKKKLLNDEERKKLKHREMWLYDKWLLNHNFVPKFINYKCINSVENVDEASFDKEKLKEYINSSNKDVDKVNFFSKLCFYNFKITSKKEMDKIFNECIDYIINYLNDFDFL